MKRAVMALVGVVGLVLGASVMSCPTSPTTDPGPSALGTASLDEVTRPASPRTPRTDARPVLVAEHDFCGGSAWIPELEMGQAITLKGDGVERGTYVVTVIEHQVRGKAKVSDLPATDVVLQTCVTPEEMVLVGVELFDPTVQS